MNNLNLNREFTQAMRDKNKAKAKTGFTDSEDDDDNSYSRSSKSTSKSPKSPKSPVSARSSLLSARSPRDEPFSTQRKTNMMSTNRPSAFQKKTSMENSRHTSSEEELSISRKETRFPKEKSSLSPKSPRSRFTTYDDENQQTPRSSNEFDHPNMMNTMRKPLNDNLTKTMKRGDTFGEDDFRMQKTRAATPTKLGITQTIQNRNTMNKNALISSNRRTTQMTPKYDDLDEEDLSRSGKSTPTHSFSRQRSGDSQSPKTSNYDLSRKQPDSPKSPRLRDAPEFKPRTHMHDSPTRSNLSPRDSLNVYDNKENKEFTTSAFDKQTKTLDNLLNNKREDSTNKKESDSFKKQFMERNLDRDPEVIETVEDSRVAERLRKEREEKRILREKRAKLQTESTQKLEKAIEVLENSTQDEIRNNNLNEIASELTIKEKPKLGETRILNADDIKTRSRSIAFKDRRPRTRSLSSSGQFDSFFKDKYAHVQPKTLTRPLQSARNNDESKTLNDSQRTDRMNDSSTIRQTIYNEWYQKKMAAAREQLKEAQKTHKDVEEEKAQKLIENLQKSRNNFKIWNESKESMLKEKHRQKLEVEAKLKKDEDEKKEKKRVSEIAFKEWLRVKQETDKDKKEETLKTERKAQKQKRKERAESKKPPVPYDAWVKKKEEVLKEKVESATERERQKKMEQREKEKKKELGQKAYLEWLDKKDEQELNTSRHSNLNKSLSNSMSSLPPFYPSSRTIPFGR